jgi:CheY-like chemotaxis protein
MDSPTEKLPQAVEVLLVEDSQYDAELILRAFRREGLANDLIWLKDGVAALEYLFAKLVLLDLKLPKVDGQEVLQRIKSDPRTRAIPVVMLTSSREESDILRSYDAGVNSYVVKPVDFDKFTEAVRQLGLYWLKSNQPPERHIPIRNNAT